MVIKATGMNNRFKFLQQQIRLHRRREMSNPTISSAEKYQSRINELSKKHTISEDKMKDKKKPLAVDMLHYLDNCQKLYMSKPIQRKREEYELDLKYITTFTLIGIFQKLEELSKMESIKYERDNDSRS